MYEVAATTLSYHFLDAHSGSSRCGNKGRSGRWSGWLRRAGAGWEVHDQLAIDPRGDATVVLARSVRLDHQFVAVPLVERGNEVGSADEVRTEVERNAGVGHDQAGWGKKWSPH